MLLFVLGLIVGVLTTYAHSLYSKKYIVRETISDNEKRLHNLVENTRDYLYYFETKPKWRYTYVYPSLEKIFGEEQGKLAYEQPHIMLDRVHPEDYDMLIKKINGQVDYTKPIIYRISNGAGNYTTFEEFTTPVYKDGELVAIQGILRNITEKLQLQQELEYRISHDSLTGVHNREFLERLFEKYNREENVPSAIFIIDLDNLKVTNDTLGHRQGDELLKEAAGLLSVYYLEGSVYLSRVGGDEFVILMVDTSKVKVEQLFYNIKRDISNYNDENKKNKMSMSIGYAFNECSLGNMEKLYEEADLKMYEDKMKRKNGIF